MSNPPAYCKIKHANNLIGVYFLEVSIKSFDQLTCGELYEILQARTAIFIVEQACSYQDIDGVDRQALHITLREDGKLLAYLRLFSRDENTAQIGRVLATERRKGYAAAVLREGIRAAREILGKKAVYLEAQTYAMDLYAKEGVRPISEEFLEDNIPHVAMQLDF